MTQQQTTLTRAADRLTFAAALYDAMVASKGDADGELAKAAADARRSAMELMALAGTPPTPIELAMKNYHPPAVERHS